MTNHARMDGNLVIETFMDTDTVKLRDVFPPSLADTFIVVPDNVRRNWYNKLGAWHPPEDE